MKTNSLSTKNNIRFSGCSIQKFSIWSNKPFVSKLCITIFTISVLITFFNFTKFLTLEFLGITLRLVQTIGNANGTLNMLVNSSVHIEKFIQFEQDKITSRSSLLQV